MLEVLHMVLVGQLQDVQNLGESIENKILKQALGKRGSLGANVKLACKKKGAGYEVLVVEKSEGEARLVLEGMNVDVSGNCTFQVRGDSIFFDFGGNPDSLEFALHGKDAEEFIRSMVDFVAGLSKFGPIAKEKKGK